MTPYEARTLIADRDPVRALRADAVDPLPPPPPPPPPCTCRDDEKVEVANLGSVDVDLLCAGRCRLTRSEVRR